MSFLQLPLRVASSRFTASRSRAQQRRKARTQHSVAKATLSGTPWRNNGACRVDDSSFDQVMKWVESYGGYVNPSLSIGYSVATGTRGILAKGEVTDSELQLGPLIAVPDNLRMNAATCRQRLGRVVDHCDLPPLERLPDDLQTSLFLAFERRKGTDSFWAEYIETLPEAPSCAWILPESDLRIELALLPSHVKESEDCVERARQITEMHHQDIATAIEDYGEALGLSSEELSWALGHVHSRAYGEGCSLIPIVDLINHSAQALPPVGSLISNDNTPMTFVGSFYCGVPRRLRPGDELFINYTFPKDLSPLEVFMDFGFLPQEFARPIPVAQAHRNGHAA